MVVERFYYYLVTLANHTIKENCIVSCLLQVKSLSSFFFLIEVSFKFVGAFISSCASVVYLHHLPVSVLNFSIT